MSRLQGFGYGERGWKHIEQRRGAAPKRQPQLTCNNEVIRIPELNVDSENILHWVNDMGRGLPGKYDADRKLKCQG